MDSSLNLQVFGARALTGPDGRVAGPAARAQGLAMLARVAADGQSGTPRDALVGLFWPDSPTDVGRHALANLVYQARKALGRDAIESRGDILRLPVDRWTVDHWTFSQALETGEERAAVSAYQGPFLEGIRVSGVDLERWIEVERRRLAEAYARALETLARSAADQNDAGQAVRWWQMAVDEDPLHSARTHELMLWLARSGDPAAALQRSERYRSLRERELGLVPEPAVQVLEQRIRAGDEAVRRASPTELDPAALRGTHAETEHAETEHIHRSVAVLPFVDLTPEGSVPHLAQGLAIALGHRLTRIEGLEVAASSSVTALARLAIDKSEIAAKLGVRSLLEGSIWRVGDEIQVTAELVDAATGYQAWSERLTGTVDELLAIEDRIGEAVTNRFLGTRPPAREENSSAAVHEDYLRGLFLASKVRQEHTEQAAQAFERVVEGAPHFAAGRAALARTLLLSVIGGAHNGRHAALERTVENADRAMELSPDSGDVQATSAWVNLFARWDLVGARQAINRSVALGIHDPYAMSLAGLTLSLCGDPSAATALAAEALRRDPFGYMTGFAHGWIARHAGIDAGPYLEALVGRRPEGFLGPLLLALSIPEETEKVATLTERALESGQDRPLRFAVATAARAQAGDTDHVEQALDLSESGSGDGETRHAERALVLGAAGRVEEAADDFVLALKNREPHALFWWRDPLIRPVLDVPRVAEAAFTLGLSPTSRVPGDSPLDDEPVRTGRRLPEAPHNT